MGLQVITILAGLGLFFYGMDLLSRSLRELTGQRIQLAFARATRNRAISFAWGAIAGGVTQSSTATSFIVVGLLSAGLVATESALPIMLGANLGSSLFPLIISFDLVGAALALIGLSGIALTIGRLRSYTVVLSALLGFALMFYGLMLVKQAAGALTADPSIGHTFQLLETNYWAAFALGFGAAVATHSGGAIFILTLSLHDQGVLSLEQAVATSFGCFLAASTITYLLASGITGVVRRVPIYQIWFNLVGVPVFGILFLIEVEWHKPLLLAFLRTLPIGGGPQIALLGIIYNVVVVGILLLTMKPASRLLEYLIPETPSDTLSRPRYLQDQALSEPHLAIVLIGREHIRLLEALGGMSDTYRDGEIARLGPIGVSARRLAQRIDDYVHRLCSEVLPASLYEQVEAALARQAAILSFADEIEALLGHAARIRQPTLSALAGAIVEGIDVKRLMVLDAMTSREPDDIQMAVEITGLSNAVAADIRRRYIELNTGSLGADERLQLLALLGCFERADYHLHALALIVLKDARAASGSDELPMTSGTTALAAG